jgi:hypothetical protein
MVGDQLDFISNNRDALLLDIGALSEDRLVESWMSARTENETTFATWNRVARRLRKLAARRATAVGSQERGSDELYQHRFTASALRLANAGVRMLTLTGQVMKPQLTVQ